MAWRPSKAPSRFALEPVFGEALLGISIGRALGALKGLVKDFFSVMSRGVSAALLASGVGRRERERI